MVNFEDLDRRLRVMRAGGRTPLRLTMSPESWAAAVEAAEAAGQRTTNPLRVLRDAYDGIPVETHRGMSGVSIVFDQGGRETVEEA